MGLFDELKGAVFQAAEGEAQNLIGGAVERAVPGGLDGLIGKLQAGGLGEQVSSWLGDGSNLPVSPDQLQSRATSTCSRSQSISACPSTRSCRD